MAASLTLATADDAPRILAMMEAAHAEAGRATSADHRAAALAPLLQGTALGEVYLIGPKLAPIGYIVLTHGYSLEYGGPDARIDDLYLRSSVRGRGVDGEIVQAVAEHLAKLGTRALHMEVASEDSFGLQTYAKRGFAPRTTRLLTRELFR